MPRVKGVSWMGVLKTRFHKNAGQYPEKIFPDAGQRR